MAKVKTAIIGASGYSGEELLRLLSKHEKCEISAVTSRQHADKPLGEVFPRFADSDLKFILPDAKAVAAECELAFLALPHGLAAEFAVPLLEAGLTVIDISADFRLRDTKKYFDYYKTDHPAPNLLEQAVYGLPEIYRSEIRKANLIACPGCYPTSIILPVAPLLRAGLLDTRDIIVSSLSGVTGAGRKVDLPFIFPECNESLRAYAPTGHRHLPEIEQELSAAASGTEIKINFVPHLVPVNRGMISTIFLRPSSTFSVEAAESVLNEVYGTEKFVRVLKNGKLPDSKHITFTNQCEIGLVYDPHTGRLIMTSAIDNLTRGASGQAIQCMNIRFSFPEDEGLE